MVKEKNVCFDRVVALVWFGSLIYESGLSRCCCWAIFVFVALVLGSLMYKVGPHG